MSQKNPSFCCCEDTVVVGSFCLPGAVAVVTSMECLDWLEKLLHSLWIPELGEARTDPPYRGMPLVILALDNSKCGLYVTCSIHIGMGWRLSYKLYTRCRSTVKMNFSGVKIRPIKIVKRCLCGKKLIRCRSTIKVQFLLRSTVKVQFLLRSMVKMQFQDSQHLNRSHWYKYSVYGSRHPLLMWL